MTRRQTNTNKPTPIELMREVISGLQGRACDESLAQRVRDLAAFVTDYDKLAPNWAKAPSGANYFTISAGGVGKWHADEPETNDILHDWTSERLLPNRFFGHVEVRRGIEWRTCKWSRRDAATKGEGARHTSMWARRGWKRTLSAGVRLC